MSANNVLLNVSGIEVIYNHVILVLKGVSLRVPEGKIVALLGGNGAGKTTTLRAVSNLLAGERGEVTKGSIELRGERIEKLSTSEMVNRGVIQWEQLIEIGEILAGNKEGRTKAEQITFYKNNAGQGVADVALGAKVLDNIQKKNGGQKLEA